MVAYIARAGSTPRYRRPQLPRAARSLVNYRSPAFHAYRRRELKLIVNGVMKFSFFSGISSRKISENRSWNYSMFEGSRKPLPPPRYRSRIEDFNIHEILLRTRLVAGKRTPFVSRVPLFRTTMGQIAELHAALRGLAWKFLYVVQWMEEI